VSASYHGHQPGDPKKLAAVVVQLAQAENPPMHLPIGTDSLENYRINARQIAEDIEAWKGISVTTDHIQS
jgi:hypothetical protein